jgi:DHA1 family tetracycline resistance protein-like MFS transporter
MLAFILLTVMLDAMGIGILIPVIPQLIIELGGQGISGSAVYGGALMAVFAIVQFVAAPVLGNLSDRVGRRPVLLVSLAAYGLSYILMGFAPTMAWLFFAQALTGLFGATPSTAGAYVADISRPEQRTARFGLVGAAFGIGTIIGPVIGGLLVQQGTRMPFFAAAALSLVTVVYGAFALPESLSPVSRRAFLWSRANPVGAFRELRQSAGVATLLTVAFLQRLALTALPATWPFFTMEVYHWSARSIGFSLAAFGLSTVVFQSVLVGPMDRRYGARRTTIIGLAMLVCGYFGFAFGLVWWASLICIPLCALGFMSGASLSSLLSHLVSGDQQGAMQGAIASVNGLAAIGAPLLLPWLFSRFTGPAALVYFPGAPYLVSALVAVAAILLMHRTNKLSERSDNPSA